MLGGAPGEHGTEESGVIMIFSDSSTPDRQIGRGLGASTMTGRWGNRGFGFTHLSLNRRSPGGRATRYKVAQSREREALNGRLYEQIPVGGRNGKINPAYHTCKPA